MASQLLAMWLLVATLLWASCLVARAEMYDGKDMFEFIEDTTEAKFQDTDVLFDSNQANSILFRVPVTQFNSPIDPVYPFSFTLNYETYPFIGSRNPTGGFTGGTERNDMLYCLCSKAVIGSAFTSRCACCQINYPDNSYTTDTFFTPVYAEYNTVTGTFTTVTPGTPVKIVDRFSTGGTARVGPYRNTKWDVTFTFGGYAYATPTSPFSISEVSIFGSRHYIDKSQSTVDRFDVSPQTITPAVGEASYEGWDIVVFVTTPAENMLFHWLKTHAVTFPSTLNTVRFYDRVTLKWTGVYDIHICPFVSVSLYTASSAEIILSTKVPNTGSWPSFSIENNFEQTSQARVRVFCGGSGGLTEVSAFSGVFFANPFRNLKS